MQQGMDAMKRKLEATLRRRPNNAAIGWPRRGH